jgi:hypothetical protein
MIIGIRLEIFQALDQYDFREPGGPPPKGKRIELS